MLDTPASPVSTFISRWKASGASERANYQLFLSELCELLGVEKPRLELLRVVLHLFVAEVVHDDVIDQGEGKLDDLRVEDQGIAGGAAGVFAVSASPVRS